NNASWAKISELGYLTSEQALADYAMFLPYYKEKYGFPNDTKVIVFGGSYGGMLATWFRLKYPTLTVGAWASSAPVIYFNGGGIDVGGFDAVVKRTYLSSGCDSETIDNAFQAITKLGQTPEGVEKLNNIFQINENTTIGLPGENYTATDLKFYIQQGIEYMAMTDYPYPTSFLEDMPGFPVKQACKRLEPAVNSTDDDVLLYALLDAVNVYYNYSGEAPTTCLDGSKCDFTMGALSGGPDGWDFQECTEVIIAMCALGPPNDFFDSVCNATTFLDWQINYCSNIYGAVGWTEDFIRLNAIRDLYGWDFTSASNIIFTNGILDPWSSAGVNENTPGITNANNRGIYNYRVAGSAHHLDLRQPNTCDPQSVIDLRVQVVEIFKCWLNPTSTACPFIQTELPGILSSFNPSNCSYIFGQYPWGESIPTATTTAPITTTTTGAAGTSIATVLALCLTAFVAFVV
uniref:Peptidase S28 n=1 Tax=Panagrellus redivivus TaxID=6233 RepID=A0A7E4VA10_PANRE